MIFWWRGSQLGDREIVELAEEVFADTERLHHAESTKQVKLDARHAEQTLDRFIVATGATLPDEAVGMPPPTEQIPPARRSQA